MRILYIEDDPSSRLLLKQSIELYIDDCHVETADTGEKGLELLMNQTVDLLLTDMELPGISGLEVLRKSKELLPSLEVMVVTAHSSVSTAVQAMQLGAREYIEKPIDVALMKEKIENIRDYNRRYVELRDAQEAKEVVEQQAGHELHLMEAQLMKTGDAIDQALALLAKEDGERENIAQIGKLLSPFSSSSSDPFVGA